MNSSSRLRAPDENNPTETLARFAKNAASVLALVSYGIVFIALIARLQLPGKPGWPEALLVFIAALTTVITLSRQLPLQNSVFGALLIGLIGTASHCLSVATGLPFGPFQYTDAIGPRLFDTLAWPIPFLWIIAVLNSRGVARLILRPWRKIRAYGFWLIGVTAVLTVLLDAALEPFANVVKHYWFWLPTRLPITWGGAPVTNFLGWLITTLLILAFVTPLLIDKRARPIQRPPDYHPLITWLLALVLFLTGAAMNQLWLAVGYCVVVGAVVTVFAVRGAKW